MDEQLEWIKTIKKFYPFFIVFTGARMVLLLVSIFRQEDTYSFNNGFQSMI